MMEDERIIDSLVGEVRWLESKEAPKPLNATFRTLYNTVFSASASKLGLLARQNHNDYWKRDEDLVPDIVTFYYSLQIFIELAEMVRDAELRSDATEPVFEQFFSLGSPPLRLRAFRRLVTLATEIKESGASLVNRLEIT
jgi:hypothetical protein